MNKKFNVKFCIILSFPIIIIFFLISCCPIEPSINIIQDWPSETILQKTNPETLDITVSVKLTNVDPYNPTIQSIKDKIWKESNGIIDYVYRCFHYIIDNFDYKNPGMGFMPLAYVLFSGGTDYGNLSSILVSLLRYKNIPSSHLVAIRPDGSSHVWADFYMEGYGWIPLDVSAEKLWGTDFFGIQPINNNGIIMTKEVNMSLNNGESIQYITGLQTFCFWYWGYGTGSLSYLYDVIKK